MVLLDDNDKIIDANDSFVDLLGYENLDLLRKYLSNYKIKGNEWIFQQNKALLSSGSASF
jgi:PAS domain-containing protein